MWICIYSPIPCVIWEGYWGRMYQWISDFGNGHGASAVYPIHGKFSVIPIRLGRDDTWPSPFPPVPGRPQYNNNSKYDEETYWNSMSGTIVEVHRLKDKYGG